jgi:hypothetical protein
MWPSDTEFFDTNPEYDTLKEAAKDFAQMVNTRNSMESEQPIRLIKRTTIEETVKDA